MSSVTATHNCLHARPDKTQKTERLNVSLTLSIYQFLPPACYPSGSTERFLASFKASLPCLTLPFYLSSSYSLRYKNYYLLLPSRAETTIKSCPLSALVTLPYNVSPCPIHHPLILTSLLALEVAVAGPDTHTTPSLNVISPTPRAFTFPLNVHSPSPSPSNSPFEPDLRPLTFSTPPPSNKTHTPSSSISSISSLSVTAASTASTLSADVPATPSSCHRRRRSTVSDINERRPKKGDEDYIKRPENAFILFRRKCCEDRNLAQGAGDAGEGDGSAPPTKKQRQADLSKTISQQWKCLSADERQYWEDLAKEKKVRASSPSLCVVSPTNTHHVTLERA